MSDSTDTELLRGYFTGFAKGDYRAMAACHHPAIRFQDPVFNLKGKAVAAMWHMLCESGQDMRIEASGIGSEQGKGRAHWTATYTFSATGRRVRNAIDSSFRFQDGRILSQLESFNFWRWSIQALGWRAVFLGWMPRLQQDFQRRAKARLEEFILSHPEYAEP